jgi:XTP/dITP diphosphohydrolase
MVKYKVTGKVRGGLLTKDTKAGGAMPPLWFASSNLHKKEELESILKLPLRLPVEAGLDFDPVEDGATFAENALIKACALFSLVSEPVIADDSGLCVDILGGRPGVLSARYGSSGVGTGGAGGKNLGAAERNNLLLAEIAQKEADIRKALAAAGKTPEGGSLSRSARFVCAFVLFLGGGRFFLAQEILEGVIVDSIEDARGEGGFGFDPILYIKELGKTVAEMSLSEKNTLSHRAKAARAAVPQLITRI